MWTSAKPTEDKAAGFTLVECVLAIAILSMVVVQVISVQANTIALTQTSRDNMRATWALRQMVSQVEYVVETKGVKELPEQDVTVPWKADERFQIRMTVKKVEIPIMKLLNTVTKMNAAMSGEDPSASEEENPLAAIGDILESQLPKDIYRTVEISVTWLEGTAKKSLEGGLLLIDDKALVMKLPDGMADMGGGAPEGRPAPGQTSPQGTGNPGGAGGVQPPPGGTGAPGGLP